MAGRVAAPLELTTEQRTLRSWHSERPKTLPARTSFCTLEPHMFNCHESKLGTPAERITAYAYQGRLTRTLQC
jgi:hypothetical protein